MKEKFFDIYKAESIEVAYRLYQSWLSDIPKELMPYFNQLTKAMNNWEKEIFSYFNMPIANAYTESLNNLIKVTNKIWRGYSFEPLRAKILFTEGYRKTKKKKKLKDVNASFGKMLDQPLHLQPLAYDWVYEKVYGADISTLAKAIEEGSL